MNKQELYSDIKKIIDNFCSNYQEEIQESYIQNNNNEDMNFEKFISRYKIEIPIIQRDYAQGRKNKNATYIREEFINDIKDVLEKGLTLHLDYIYGNIDKQKFEPLDGQQRLTTLFLIHLYLYKKYKKECSFLKEFTYQTRTAAKEFFEDIVANLAIPQEENTKISEQIKDSNWFVSQWIHDPTVSGCLTVLDTIQEKLKNIDSEKIKNLKNITFKLLDMGKLSLYDDLYIKMNSRGKALTDFENLKAQMIQYIQEVNSNGTKNKFENFSKNIDNYWSEFLWKKANCLDKIDNMHLRIIVMGVIKTITEFAIGQKMSNKDFAKIISRLINAIPENDNNDKYIDKVIFDLFKNKDFTKLFSEVFESTQDEEKNEINKSFRQYKQNKLIQNIQSIYEIVCKFDGDTKEMLSKNNINYSYENYNTDEFLKNINDLILLKKYTYSDCFLFLSQILYLETNFDNIDYCDFIKWIRFVRNLISIEYISKANGKFKSEPYIRDRRFLEPYKVSQKIKDCKTVSNLLGNEISLITNVEFGEEIDEKNKLSSFIIHEKQKYKYIIKNSEKAEIIYKLENNILFKGDLQFLFNNFLDNIDLDFSKALEVCFNNNEVSDGFRFAFLSINEKAYDLEKNHHTCNTYNDDVSHVIKYRLFDNYADIKRCLSDKSGDDVKGYFISFFDKLYKKRNEVNPLKAIIVQYLNENENHDWRYNFINSYNQEQLKSHVPYIVIYDNENEFKVAYLRITHPVVRERDFYPIMG